MKKYKVTQEFMEALNKWKEDFKNSDGVVSISIFALERLPTIVDEWRFDGINRRDKNERFGAIINWVNGENVFKIGAPKYVVQQIENRSRFIRFMRDGNVEIFFGIKFATRFDDFNEASEWANTHFEVVEVDE